MAAPMRNHRLPVAQNRQELGEPAFQLRSATAAGPRPSREIDMLAGQAATNLISWRAVGRSVASAGRCERCGLLASFTVVPQAARAAMMAGCAC